jgi:hypothetical protein
VLEGLHESLADVIALGAANGRKAGDEVQRDGEVGGLAGGVGGAVVREPLDRVRGAERLEAPFDAVQHHVADHLAGDAAAGGADPGHDLAVMGVDGEGNADHLAVPAWDLEAI